MNNAEVQAVVEVLNSIPTCASLIRETQHDGNIQIVGELLCESSLFLVFNLNYFLQKTSATDCGLQWSGNQHRNVHLREE